jgi:hypothetical protein
MAEKIIRTKLGKVTIKSIRLRNGRLLIPARAADDQDEVVWKEVAPGTSDFKRWSAVAVQEPDPRKPPRRPRTRTRKT